MTEKEGLSPEELTAKRNQVLLDSKSFGPDMELKKAAIQARQKGKTLAPKKAKKNTNNGK